MIVAEAEGREPSLRHRCLARTSGHPVRPYPRKPLGRRRLPAPTDTLRGGGVRPLPGSRGRPGPAERRAEASPRPAEGPVNAGGRRKGVFPRGPRAGRGGGRSSRCPSPPGPGPATRPSPLGGSPDSRRSALDCSRLAGSWRRRGQASSAERRGGF